MNELQAMEHRLMTAIDALATATADGFARVEVRLDGIEARLEKVEFRLGKVELRVDAIEGRLPGVEGRLAGVEGRLGAVERGLADLRGEFSEFRIETRTRLERLERGRPRRPPAS